MKWIQKTNIYEDTEFYQRYLKIKNEYNIFSQNTPYKMHPAVAITSQNFSQVKEFMQQKG
ncbi:MAG: hypothetical protein MRERC_3c095 [Mycoplasmataceae bacterium RC_NB112A]|nr:MAG: hypothetical protein MRERC_12c038 [Mycoplasmataceae bacterium RC_NB112A]KLL02250.1 MAG: hypothetical protein MRERC_3c095 [Mycoplasmataceae bacterium RC_NB112A]